MRTSTKVVGGVVALLVLGSWLGDDDVGPTADSVLAVPSAVPSADGLLKAGSGGDGDSWKDTSGREYRLGMVNAPEVGECWSGEATAARRTLIAGGFRADVYAKDRYGRGVSLVTAADGTNVNVALARGGHVDDRYLDDFRHENRSLAAELDAAFAAAKQERAGLWGVCRGTAPQGFANDLGSMPKATAWAATDRFCAEGRGRNPRDPCWSSTAHRCSSPSFAAGLCSPRCCWPVAGAVATSSSAAGRGRTT